jgi:hypothetical protein
MSRANGTLIKMDISNLKEDKVRTNEATLEMEVYEDKEYDIEEVRFWNFISKNKGTKPSVIRTCVYKCPESSYVFTKCTVTKPKKEKNKILLPHEEVINKKDSESDMNDEPKLEQKEKKAFKSSISTDCVKSKPEPAKIPQPEIASIAKVNKIKSTKPTSITSKPKLNEMTEVIPKVSPAQRPIPVLPTKPVSFVDSTHNYKMEDLILIDEDDDIIGYNEDEDDIQNEALSVENDIGKSNQFDEDDDEVEDTDDEDEQMELNSRDDDEDNESYHSDDESHLELENQKNETFKIAEQPKVVLETVEDEPRKKKINLKQKQTKIINSQIENKTNHAFSQNKNNSLKKPAVVSKENFIEDRAFISSTTSTPFENETNMISSSSSNLTITTKTESNFISNASVSSTSSITPDATNTEHEKSLAAATIQTNTSVSKNVISVSAPSSTLSSFVDNIISATSALDSAINSSSIFTSNSSSSNSISNSSASIKTDADAAATSSTTITTALPAKSIKTNSK